MPCWTTQYFEKLRRTREHSSRTFCKKIEFFRNELRTGSAARRIVISLTWTFPTKNFCHCSFATCAKNPTSRKNCITPSGEIWTNFVVWKKVNSGQLAKGKKKDWERESERLMLFLTDASFCWMDCKTFHDEILQIFKCLPRQSVKTNTPTERRSFEQKWWEFSKPLSKCQNNILSLFVHRTFNCVQSYSKRAKI